jgi:hypothetical protein
MEQAIDKIRNRLDEIEEHEMKTKSYLREVIETCRSLRSREEWVPCSERLPDTKRDVLVYGGSGPFIEMDNYDGEFWHTAPSHWRELPPAPPTKERTA